MTSASGRGNISPEAAKIQDARNRRRRAEKCGFHSIEDRVEHDVQFMERMLQMGHDFRAAQRQDWLCHCHLANPPHNKAQVSLGLGYDEDHPCQAGLYVDVVLEQYPEAMDYVVEQWCILYRANILLLREYSEYVKTPMPIGISWPGTVSTPSTWTNPLRMSHLPSQPFRCKERRDCNKLNQEQRQQQAKGKRKFFTDEGAPASKAKGAQPPSSVSPTTSASSFWGWSSWDWSSSRSWGRWS